MARNGKVPTARGASRRTKKLDYAFVERFLASVGESLNDEAATKLAALKMGPELQERMDVLASKCNNNELTYDEHREYEHYVAIGTVVDYLKAQALLRLSKKRR